MACVELGKGDHRLRTTYKEAPILRGYTERGAVMQLYRDETSSTWSLTLITPEGEECMVMSGEKLKTVPWLLDNRAY